MKVRFGLQQVCAVTAAFALLMAQATQAQQEAAPGVTNQSQQAAIPVAMQNRISAAGKEREAAPKSGGEGIKVHGHWKFVVKNPDGSLARQLEFENSLVTPGGGDAVLTYLLGGWAVAGGWQVRVSSSGGTGLCGGTGNCEIMAASTASFGQQQTLCSATPGLCVTNLTTTLVNNFAGSYNSGQPMQLQFQGSIVATGATTINTVATFFGGCVNTGDSGVATANPSACLAGTAPNEATGPGAMGVYFTSANLDGLNGDPSALPVTSGQTVTVTVTISFS